MVDNDYALGRILEYLSGTKWWKDTAVFITEDDPQGGVDHIDSHRTVLLCAGPWMKKHYVSHVNTSFPGLLKTIFGLLKLPPLNLFDASAAGLNDCFAAQPDPARLQTAWMWTAAFSTPTRPGFHQREALAEDGRSQGSGTVRLSGTGA